VPFDIWATANNTRTIQRRFETRREQKPQLIERILPMAPSWERRVKLRRLDVKAVGMAALRAPQASPSLYSPTIKITDTEMQLLIIDEMTPIEEDLWERLTSRVEETRLRAGATMIQIAQALQLRNEHRSRWLGWQALTGTLSVNYPNAGQTLTVDYDIPSTLQPTDLVAWTDHAASDPVETIRGWQEVMADECGEFGLWVHMNSNTFRHILLNEKVMASLTGSQTDLYQASRQQIERLLHGGESDEADQASRIFIYNGGVREEAAGYDRGLSSHTKFIPDGYVLITPPNYEVEGDPLGEMLDGRVAVGAGFNNLVWRMGAQSEVMADQETHGWKWRQSSSRIPRLIIPEGIMWARGY
jgi:hypothetical protein